MQQIEVAGALCAANTAGALLPRVVTHMIRRMSHAPSFAQSPFGRPLHDARPSQVPEAGLPHILIGDRVVEYRLRRSARRTLAMRIDRRGLSIAAPQRASAAQIERFLRENAGWLTEKLDEWGAAQRRQALHVVDGAQFPLLGAPCTLSLDRGPWRANWSPTGLVLTVPPRLTPPAALRMALEERAIELFRLRATGCAAVLGVALPPLALSNARTRWGSCSRRSGVRLNWRLIHLPLPLIDYVVAHELAHLIEMNHSPRFWAVVARMCPDYRARRGALAELARSIPDF